MPAGLSNREAAKIAGVSHVAIAKARKNGHLSALPDGSIDRDALEKWNAERRLPRGGNRSEVTAGAPGVPVTATAAEAGCVDGSAARNAKAALALLDAEGLFVTRGEAERHSASYVAKLRQIEYEDRCRTTARVNEMTDALGAALARVRTRFSALPVEVAPELARKRTVPEIVEELRRAINEALEELSDCALPSA